MDPSRNVSQDDLDGVLQHAQACASASRSRSRSHGSAYAWERNGNAHRRDRRPCAQPADLPTRRVVTCGMPTGSVYRTDGSARRATTGIRACEEKGLVAKALSYNSLFRYLERADLAPLLKALVN